VASVAMVLYVFGLPVFLVLVLHRRHHRRRVAASAVRQIWRDFVRFRELDKDARKRKLTALKDRRVSQQSSQQLERASSFWVHKDEEPPPVINEREVVNTYLASESGWQELAFLHREYKGKRFYTEVFETLRKLFLTSVVIALAEGRSGLDVLVALVVLLMSVALHCRTFPFREYQYNVLRSIILLTETVTMTCMMMFIYADIQPETAMVSVLSRAHFGDVHDTNFLTLLVFAAHLVCIATIFCVLVLALRVSVRRTVAHVQQRKIHDLTRQAMLRGEIYRSEDEQASLFAIVLALRAAKRWRLLVKRNPQRVQTTDSPPPLSPLNHAVEVASVTIAPNRATMMREEGFQFSGPGSEDNTVSSHLGYLETSPAGIVFAVDAANSSARSAGMPRMVSPPVFPTASPAMSVLNGQRPQGMPRVISLPAYSPPPPIGDPSRLHQI